MAGELKMDVMGKLVELIRCADYHPCGGSVRKIGSMFTTEFIEDIASQLIANGVTVQERGYWASLTDCANAGVYCSVCHKKVYKEDYARCNRKNKLRSDYCPHCGAKMMPQQPKGE